MGMQCLDRVRTEPVTYVPESKQAVFKNLRHGVQQLLLPWKGALQTPFVLDGAPIRSRGTTIISSVLDKEVRVLVGRRVALTAWINS